MLTLEQAEDYDFVKKAVQACKSDLQVFDIQRMGGRCNYTFIVNKNVVVRFFKDKNLEEEVHHRKEILDFLAPKLPFKISQYDIYSAEFLGKPLVMTVAPKIEGWTLFGKRFRELPTERRRYILDQLAVFETDLHTIPKVEWQSLGVPALSDKIKSALKQSPKVAKIVGYLGQSICKKNECLLHGDLHAGNFNIDSQYRITGVFDFDWLSYGNQVFDMIMYPQYAYMDCVYLKKACEKAKGEKIDYFNRAMTLRNLFILSYFNVPHKTSKIISHLSKDFRLISRYLIERQKRK